MANFRFETPDQAAQQIYHVFNQIMIQQLALLEAMSVSTDEHPTYRWVEKGYQVKEHNFSVTAPLPRQALPHRNAIIDRNWKADFDEGLESVENQLQKFSIFSFSVVWDRNTATVVVGFTWQYPKKS